MEAKETTKNDLTKLVHELTKNFQDCFNGECGRHTKEWLASTMHDDWMLVNRNVPNMMGNKQTFLTVWETFYGAYKDDKVKMTAHIKSIRKISPECFIVTYIETSEREDETTKRPMTTVFKKDEDNTYQSMYVHE